MKISFLSLAAVIISMQLLIASPIKSQTFENTKVTISAKSISLKEIIREIEKQTHFKFAYVEADISSIKSKAILSESEFLPVLLQKLLKETNLEYSVKNNTIIILKRETEKVFSHAPVSETELIYSPLPGKSITGTVLDENGKPLKGASITVKGETGAGTFTDDNGKFRLQSKTDFPTLIVSYVGYKSQEIKVGSANSYTINLKLSDASLNEVVVTAFGLSNSKRSLVSTVSSVNASQITNAGTDNIGSSLAGKLPGADFVATSGGPMAGTRINLRGINSLDVSSRPLIVVNGIPIFDNDDSYSTRGFGNSEKGSGINDINPEDIESVTVLKGANASALYGSQAINGAIIIETKTGKNAKGIGLEYSTNYTLNQNYGFPKFQEQYGAGVGADNFDKYLYGVAGADSIPFYSPNISNINFGPKFNNQPVMWWDGAVRPWKAQPNNYKDLFSNGSTFNNTVAMSGSTEKGSYRLSVTNYNYNGFLPNMKETRNSVLFYTTQKVSEYVTADLYLNYIDNYRQNPPERIDRANYSLMTNDITSVIEANTISNLGYYLSDSAMKYVNGTNLSSNVITPLIWDQKMYQYQDHRNSLLGTATVTIKLPEHFSLRLRGGTDRLYDQLELKEPFTTYVAATNLAAKSGYYSKATTNNYKNHGDLLLSYNNQLNKNISLNAFAGYSMDDEWDETNSIASINGLLYNNMYSVANFKPLLVTAANTAETVAKLGAAGTQGGERLDAVFGSATVGYKKWLYVNVTDRNDWSSYLPPATNHYNYPSVGAGFIFSDYFKMPGYVSFGKLKASYGVTGVPGSRYFANASFTQGGTYNSAITSTFTNTVPPANMVAEKNHAFEIGLEGGLWQNRLRFDLTYYVNTSNNMINSVAIAASTGAANMNVNAGSLQNKGIEWQITGEIIKKQNFYWGMVLNGTQVSRKVLSLPSGLTKRLLAGAFTTNMYAIPGAAPYDIYMNPLQKNADGAIQVNASGNPVFNTTQAKVGNPLPKVYGGYINTFRYKHLSLNVLLEYRYGGQVVSYDNVFWTATGLSKASLAGRDAANGGLSYYVQGGATVAGTAPAGAIQYHDGILFKGEYANGTPNTSIVKASTYYQNRYYNFGTSDAVYNNDYLKLGEISLGYSFPQSMIKKLKVQGLTISLIARNIGYLYKTVPNEQPTASLGTDNLNQGILYSAYPPTRDLGASLKVSF